MPTIAYAILMVLALPASALQLKLNTNMNLRFVAKGEARNYDSGGSNYVLKAGTVIEIPDEVVVNGANGQPDLVASMKNWLAKADQFESPIGKAGKFPKRNKGERKGNSKIPFMPVKVISATKGSVVPPNGFGYLAMQFLAEKNKITPTGSVAEAAPIIKKPGDDGYVFPLPRPKFTDQGANNTDGGEVAAIIENANDATKGVGTDSEVCPEGHCGEAQVGDEEPGTVACDYVYNYGYPDNLAGTYNRARDKYEIIADWFQGQMSDPRKCMDACPAKSDTKQWAQLKFTCAQLQECHDHCSSNKIDAYKCNKTGRANEAHCLKTCSPWRGMSYGQKSAQLKALIANAHAELLNNNSKLGNKMAKSGGPKTQGMRMACLNKERENRQLDPMDANCESSAVGFGQVLKGTFFETFGISDINKNKCQDIPLNKLQGRCPKFNSAMARLDVYGKKYAHLTPRQMYERRTFDVDLQARSAYGAWINKMQYFDYSVKKSFKGWFGKSDASAIERINACTENGEG